MREEESHLNILKFFEDIRININRDDVFRLLGRRSGNAPGRIAKRLDRFTDLARGLVRPKVLYSTRNIEGVGKGMVALEGGISLKSGTLSKTLGKCDTATVFLATIGNDIDGVIKDLSNENKLSDAYIYDAIGSVAVERAVDDFQSKFDLALSDSRKSTTVRFSPGYCDWNSPGYCDWNIKEQAKIFEVLDGGAAGVSLSPNFLMDPRKSVSGVFGIAPGPAEVRPNPCTMCSKESCIARR
jgi:hypothetical protein